MSCTEKVIHIQNSPIFWPTLLLLGLHLPANANDDDNQNNHYNHQHNDNGSHCRNHTCDKCNVSLVYVSPVQQFTKFKPIKYSNLKEKSKESINAQ